MQLKQAQIYIILMFAVFPNYVFASLFPRTTYTLRSEILGEDLERIRRWKTSTSRLNKDFNPKIGIHCQHGCGMSFP